MPDCQPIATDVPITATADRSRLGPMTAQHRPENVSSGGSGRPETTGPVGGAKVPMTCYFAMLSSVIRLRAEADPDRPSGSI